MSSPSLLSRIFGTKPNTAQKAKDRLQFIIAHEHGDNGKPAPDFLPALQRELIEVISKYYAAINPEDIKVCKETKDNLEILEVKIELPEKA